MLQESAPVSVLTVVLVVVSIPQNLGLSVRWSFWGTEINQNRLGVNDLLKKIRESLEIEDGPKAKIGHSKHQTRQRRSTNQSIAKYRKIRQGHCD